MLEIFHPASSPLCRLPVWGYRAVAFMITALSRSKCRHIQSFLQRAKANALRLNELLHAELLSIAALTPAQLVINQATARYPQTGTTYTLLWITQPLLNRIIQNLLLKLSHINLCKLKIVIQIITTVSW